MGKAQWGRAAIVILVVVAIAVVISLATGGTDEPAAAPPTTSAPSTAPPTTAAPDHSGLACDHFRNVAKDFSDGVLTMDELRGKLREVDESAKGIATEDVQTSARAMLAAITAGDNAGLSTAIGKMDAACTAAGH